MRTCCLSVALGLSLLLPSAARAQFDAKEKPHGIRLDKELTQRWKVGVSITAVGGPCYGLTGTIPVPTGVVSFASSSRLERPGMGGDV